MAVAKKKTPVKKKVVKKPVFDNGWVSVEGITKGCVGTGLPGEANKIMFGQKVNLPKVLAGQLIRAKQVKEIK